MTFSSEFMLTMVSTKYSMVVVTCCQPCELFLSLPIELASAHKDHYFYELAPTSINIMTKFTADIC